MATTVIPDDFHQSFVENVDPYRQIDFVLDYIKANSVGHGAYINHSNIEHHIIGHRTTIGIKRVRLYQILNRLQDDKYILIRGNYRMYDITFEGVIFQGYQKQYLDNAIAEGRKNRRETYLIVGSWMAGLGAMLLVLIELLKHLGWVLSINMMTSWFLYSLGICTGILAILLGDKVLQRRAR